jgi:hypothetical protein
MLQDLSCYTTHLNEYKSPSQQIVMDLGVCVTYRRGLD